MLLVLVIIVDEMLHLLTSIHSDGTSESNWKQSLKVPTKDARPQTEVCDDLQNLLHKILIVYRM